MNKTILSACIGLTAISACQSKKDQPRDRERPNVLFIAIDDMNDWVHCLDGRKGVETPHLDQLVKEGVLFSNAHCSAPACCPSRASLMTGVRPSTSGVYANSDVWRNAPALDTAQTIPEYFRQIGYTTKGGGKIFHALSWIRTAYGIDQNDPSIWDEYFPSKERSLPESIWPESARKDSNGTVFWEPMAGGKTEHRPAWFFDYGPLGQEEQMADYKVVDWALKELHKEHKKPLFLAVGLFRPHIPWFVPQKYFDRYPLEEVTLPKIRKDDLEDVSPVTERWVRKSWQRWMIENKQWKKAVRAYQASITFSDAMLGRLIDGLRQTGQFDNTIIVLWSDHGMHIGEKQQWEKFTLWEESTRVPMAFIAPGIKQGAICEEAVSLLDIFPTLVELTGHKPFGQLEGQSLVPLLHNPDKDRARPAITTWHPNNHAVRTERWRFIQYHNGDRELYDHQNDPDEFHNLAGQPKYESIMDSLHKWIPNINAEPLK